MATTEPTVHATGAGEMFHRTNTCRNMTQSQKRPSRGMSLTEAIAAHKRPCTYCYPTPDTVREVMPPVREDFGHSPLMYDGAMICGKCYTVSRAKRHPVYWPCTSAIIFGLAPRPEGQAE